MIGDGNLSAMCEATCAALFRPLWPHIQGSDREELLAEVAKVLEAAQAPALLTVCERALAFMRSMPDADNVGLTEALESAIAAARGELGAK